MKKTKKLCQVAMFLSSFVVMACASVENPDPPATEEPALTSVKVPAPEIQTCKFSEDSDGAHGPRRVRLMEPPFTIPRDQSVLSPDLTRDLTPELYVLRFQAVEIDAQQFLDFLYQESEISHRECWSSVLLNVFDEEPIEVYRDRLMIYEKSSSSIRGVWVGRSRGDMEVAYQFVLEPNGAISMSIESSSKVFRVNQTEMLPYHYLAEWTAELVEMQNEMRRDPF